VRLLNKARGPRAFTLEAQGLPKADMRVVGAETHAAGGPRLTAGADSVASYRVFVTLPPEAAVGESTPIAFSVTGPDGERAVRDSVFRGPE
jgi:hypothetical protein